MRIGSRYLKYSLMLVIVSLDFGNQRPLKPVIASFIAVYSSPIKEDGNSIAGAKIATMRLELDAEALPVGRHGPLHKVLNVFPTLASYYPNVLV